MIKIVKWIFYYAIVAFALMMVIAFMIGTGDDSVPTTSEPVYVPEPTISTQRAASQILPRCVEIGDGTGWTANYEIDDANNTAEGHYYKDDRVVIINVSVMEDRNEALIRYYDLHEQWGRDEYSPLEYSSHLVGEMSMLRIYECPSGYGHNCIETGNGCFVTGNIIITVEVEDYSVTARDVGRYAGQIDI